MLTTEDPRIHGLYVIIDPAACAERSPIDIATQAITGGASVIQWRDKTRDKGDQLADARALAALCRAHGVTFIINDHADLAVACNADGVHLGQRDLPVEAVRPVLGRPAIVGVSTNSASEAIRAQEAGADYVAVGAIFPTGTKSDTRPADLARIQDVKAAVRIPVVAIGGINASNIAAVIEAGADAAAVISAMCGAPDPEEAARTLAQTFGPPPAPEQRAGITQKRRAALRGIVEQFVDALRRRDRETFLTLFAEDGIIQEQPPLPSGVGLGAIAAWWDKLMLAQPSYRIEVQYIHVPAEEAALVWTIAHQHHGEARTARGIAIISFEGTAIASIHSYWDRGKPANGIEVAVEQYGATLNKRDREGYLALFAPEAVHQDPVGSPARIGRAAIGIDFDAGLADYGDLQVSASSVHYSGEEAAIAWSAVERRNNKRRTFHGVDVLTVQDDGKISSIHGYWEPDNPPPFE